MVVVGESKKEEKEGKREREEVLNVISVSVLLTIDEDFSLFCCQTLSFAALVVVKVVQ